MMARVRRVGGNEKAIVASPTREERGRRLPQRKKKPDVEPGRRRTVSSIKVVGGDGEGERPVVRSCSAILSLFSNDLAKVSKLSRGSANKKKTS